MDSGNEAVLPGLLWNGSRTFTPQGRQDDGINVEQMIRRRAEVEDSGLARRMMGEDLRLGQGIPIVHCCVSQRKRRCNGKLPMSCFSHTVEFKTSKNKDRERTCANHYPWLVVHWLCCIRHLISFRLTHIL